MDEVILEFYSCYIQSRVPTSFLNHIQRIPYPLNKLWICLGLNFVENIWDTVTTQLSNIYNISGILKIRPLKKNAVAESTKLDGSTHTLMLSKYFLKNMENNFTYF